MHEVVNEVFRMLRAASIFEFNLDFMAVLLFFLESILALFLVISLSPDGLQPESDTLLAIYLSAFRYALECSFHYGRGLNYEGLYKISLSLLVVNGFHLQVE